MDTYDLVVIEVVGHADASRSFDLYDAQGGKVTNVTGRCICSQPQMWNLVYNGMAHSVANGAIVKGTGADFVLKLDRFKPE